MPKAASPSRSAFSSNASNTGVRREVAERGIDDLQNFGGGSLLRQRLIMLGCADQARLWTEQARAAARQWSGCRSPCRWPSGLSLERLGSPFDTIILRRRGGGPGSVARARG